MERMQFQQTKGRWCTPMKRSSPSHANAGKNFSANRPSWRICRAEKRGTGVDCTVRPELLLASDPLANLEGTSSAIHFDLDVFGLTLVEHNPGVDATAYGLLADFLRAVRPAA